LWVHHPEQRSYWQETGRAAAHLPLRRERIGIAGAGGFGSVGKVLNDRVEFACQILVRVIYEFLLFHFLYPFIFNQEMVCQCHLL
jgi:hypothetical protein